MKKLLSIVGITSIIASPLSLLSNNLVLNDKSKNNMTLNNSIKQQNNISKYNYLDNYFKSLNHEVREAAKANFLASIYVKNNLILINVDSLNNNIFTKEIKQIYKSFSFSNEYISLIKFKNNLNYLDSKPQPRIDGITIEFKWYWFGWGKIIFDHEKSQTAAHILDTASNVIDVVDAISGWFPGTAVAVSLLSLFLVVNSFIFSSYDNGSGVWIGTYGCVIFDVGWGSN